MKFIYFSVKISDSYAICSFPKEFLKNSDDIKILVSYEFFGGFLFERILFGPNTVVK